MISVIYKLAVGYFSLGFFGAGAAYIGLGISKKKIFDLILGITIIIATISIVRYILAVGPEWIESIFNGIKNSIINKAL